MICAPVGTCKAVDVRVRRTVVYCTGATRPLNYHRLHRFDTEQNCSREPDRMSEVSWKETNSAAYAHTHHSASPRASLAAGSGTDNIPSLRSDTPLPQRISAFIPRREHSSESRRGKPPSSTVVHNNNACRSAGAEIYPGWPCFPRRCTACMVTVYHHLFELFPPSFHSDTSWRHFYSSTVLTDIY